MVIEVGKSSAKISSAVKEPYDVLRQAMKSVCLVYDVLFLGLMDTGKKSCEDMFEELQALMCDAPYNTCQIAELSSSEKDRLSVQNMSHFVKFQSALMDVGLHEHQFFCAVQFKTLYNLFLGEVKNVVE